MACPGIKGKAPGIKRVNEDIRVASRCREPVLILGERGVGKDLAARAIHRAAGRPKDRFVAVNCGALSESLVDSELFGHEEGAFTGATGRRLGVAALSRGGTLFFDEIGVMRPGLQSKLLRLVGEGDYRPLGSERVLRLEAQVIAATNVNLANASREGRFMPDLLDRLTVFTIVIPPLRERREDIPVLLRTFFGRKKRYDLWQTIRDHHLDWLTVQVWPGNVRQLRNFVTRVCLMGRQCLRSRISVEAQYRSGEPVQCVPEEVASL